MNYRFFKQNFLEFSVNIDVTRYHNGKRETYNPEGRAHASVVWDYYQVCICNLKICIVFALYLTCI